LAACFKLGVLGAVAAFCSHSRHQAAAALWQLAGLGIARFVGACKPVPTGSVDRLVLALLGSLSWRSC
jgi:hypothetical protein